MDALLTLAEAAERLGHCPETVRLMCKRGVIAYLQRPGCAIRILESDLTEYVNRWRVPASQPESDADQTAKDGGSSTAKYALRRKRKISKKLKDSSLNTSSNVIRLGNRHA